MADATLQQVIDKLKEEGTLTRDTGANSLSVAIVELRGINVGITSLGDMLLKNAEAMREAAQNQARLATLKDDDRGSRGPRGEGFKNVATGIGSATSGIGKGLAMAGLGVAAIAGLASMMKFDADKIKKNVETLLSIADLPGMTVGNVAGVSATMGALGLGLAAFSIGQAAGAIAQFISKDDWPETIKKNVGTLLSISDVVKSGDTSLLEEGGKFFLAMTGIGVGLAAFGVGQAVTALAQFTSKDDWAQQVVNNVTTLMKLADMPWSQAASAVVKFPTVLGAMGLGLAAFGAGKAVEGLGSAVSGSSEWVTKFSSGQPFGQRVYDEVTTLLDILDHPNAGFGGAASFVATMGGIGAGLVAFSIGKGAEGIAQGAQEGIRAFTEGDAFADRVKKEVQTLLSIASLPGVGADTAQFILTMGGIGAGLAAFAIGKGVEGVAGGMQGVLSAYTTGEPFAERIKKEVETLMTIPALAEKAGGTEKLKTALGDIGEALSSFAGDKLSSSLKNLGSAALGLISGDEGPIAEMLSLADKSDDLEKASTALQAISKAMSDFSNVKSMGEVDFSGFTKNVARSLPIIQGLVQGGFPKPGSGEIEMPGLLTKDLEIPKGGIFDANLRLEEFAAQMQKINSALGISPVASPTANAGTMIGQTSAQNAAGAGGGGAVVAPTTVGPTYNAPVYNGPVTINNDSSTSFGLNPNDKSQMAGAF